MIKSTMVGVSVLAGVLAVGSLHVLAQSKSKTPVKNGPDFVIVEQGLTKITVGGCNKEDPLFTGTLAVVNKGNEKADRLLAVAIAAAYIPENLDMKHEVINANSLAADEVFSVNFEVGKGLEKAGRGFNTSRTVYLVIDPFNKIVEANENNNIVKKTLSFKCPK